MNVNANVQARSAFLHAFKDPAFEPFKEQYLPHLRALNEIIKGVGEPLEGNIFYANGEPNPGDTLIDVFRPKRRALATFSIMHSSIFEIGFNSGFSALLALTANPKLRITSADICMHKYTVPCFEYLKSVFGDRINLIEGNSLVAAPLHLSQDNSYTAYHIDGAHDIPTAEADLNNVIRYAKKGSILCFDDTDFRELRLLVGMYVLKGDLTDIGMGTGMSLYDSNMHMFFRIN